MRLFLTTIVLLLFSINVNSQIENLQNFDQKKIHFGYFVGFNQYNYKLDYKNNPDKRTLIKQKAGLNVGLIADLKLNENLNLRLDVFNLFDFDSVDDIREYGEQSNGDTDLNYLKPTSYQPMRRVRLGFKYTY